MQNMTRAFVCAALSLALAPAWAPAWALADATVGALPALPGAGGLGIGAARSVSSTRR